jgi:LmbE family N-acetylglucosaminyl deacetylase
LLVIAPHPDDESFGCGALIAEYCASGGEVYVAVITDGGACEIPPEFMLEDICNVRRRELHLACEELGVCISNVIFLDFPDGKVEKYQQDVRIALVNLIARLKPTLVALPAETERHTDHSALSSIVQLSILECNHNTSLLFYSVWLPMKDALAQLGSKSLYKISSKPSLRKKVSALKHYKSQLRSLGRFPGGAIKTTEDFERFYTLSEIYTHKAGST